MDLYSYLTNTAQLVVQIQTGYCISPAQPTGFNPHRPSSAHPPSAVCVSMLVPLHSDFPQMGTELCVHQAFNVHASVTPQPRDQKLRGEVEELRGGVEGLGGGAPSYTISE